MSSNPHLEHRQRVKRRFYNEGLDHFEDYQVLEFLLFYAIPQKDTVPLARELLKQFGSFSGVLDADIHQLKKINGIGEHSAALISSITHIFRFYQKDKNDSTKLLDSTEKLGNYLSSRYIGEVDEVVYLLCFNQKNQLICCEEIGRGRYNSVIADTRKILEIALRVNAHSVVLSHNHPQYWSLPSHEDCYMTEQLIKRLKVLGISFWDHIIASSDGYYSMRDHGLI